MWLINWILSYFQDKEIEGEGDYLSEHCGPMGDKDER